MIADELDVSKVTVQKIFVEYLGGEGKKKKERKEKGKFARALYHTR